MRKNLVGASVLADYSIGKLKEIQKPILVLIVYTDRGVRQIHNFVEKLKVAREYYRNLKDIRIFLLQDFCKENLNHN